MPGRISAEQAAQLGLHNAPQSQRISPDDAAALGLHDAAPPKESLADRPWTAGALNALDSLSVVGVPTIMGGKDALFNQDSANDGKEADPRKSLLERYYANKEFYRNGMDRLEKGNKSAALAGKLAPALIPGGALMKGAKLGKTMLTGALTGAAYGAARGPSHTLDGEVLGTLGDAAEGGSIGAVAGGAGYGVGKVLGIPFRYAAKKAEEGLGRFRGEVEKRVRSQVGEANQIQGEGIGGLMNENDRLSKIKELLQKAAQGAPRGQERVNLAQRGLNAANAAEERALDELKKNGNQAAPSVHQMFAGHAEELKSELNKRIAGGAKDAVIAAGAHAVNPGLGYFLAGRKFAGIEDAARAIAMHPTLMAKVMKFASPAQQILARKGGKYGVDAARFVLTKRQPDIEKALSEEDGARLPYEPEGSMYRRVYPNGR